MKKSKKNDYEDSISNIRNILKNMNGKSSSNNDENTFKHTVESNPLEHDNPSNEKKLDEFKEGTVIEEESLEIIDISVDEDSVDKSNEDSINTDSKDKSKPLIINGKVLDDDSFIYVDKESVQENLLEDAPFEEVFAKVDEILDDDKEEKLDEDDFNIDEIKAIFDDSSIESDNEDSSEPKTLDDFKSDNDNKENNSLNDIKEEEISKEDKKQRTLDIFKSKLNSKSEESLNDEDAILDNIDDIFEENSKEENQEEEVNFIGKLKDISIKSFALLIAGAILLVMGISFFSGNSVRIVDNVASGETAGISIILIIVGGLCLIAALIDIFSFSSIFGDTLNEIQNMEQNSIESKEKTEESEEDFKLINIDEED